MGIKTRHLFIISIIFIILFFKLSSKKLCYYSEIKYGNTTEHIDITVRGLKFEILHYILDKDSRLILSEEMSGISLRKSKGGYLFLPFNTHQYSAFNGQPQGSLSSLGMLSACIYDVGNKKNIITFFNNERGFIDIGGKTIHLSSLLLGIQGKHIHPFYYEEPAK